MENHVIKYQPGEVKIPDVKPLLEFSRAMVKSGMFSHVKNEWEAAAIVEYGKEIGIPGVRALQNMAVIRGKICVEAKVLLALANQNGVKHKFLEKTDKVVRMEFAKEGRDPHIEEYTIEEAKRKGYLTKDNWRINPQEMLTWRCAARGVRAFDPMSTMGLYASEEMQDAEEAPVFKGKTLKVNGSKVEEVKAIEVVEKELDSLVKETIEEAEVLDAEVVEEKPKPKRTRKKKEEAKPIPEPTAEVDSQPEPPLESNPVAELKTALELVMGTKYEDQYRLFKVFLADLGEKKNKHFVTKNEFGHWSLNTGKKSDVELLLKHLDWGMAQFTKWKADKGVDTWKDYEGKQNDSTPF